MVTLVKDKNFKDWEVRKKEKFARNTYKVEKEKKGEERGDERK